MTTDQSPDFDGCNSECRKAGKHSLRWGGCEQATPPEPTVSMSVVYTDHDGGPSIGFDTYTVPELARLIEPVLGDPLKAAAAARRIVHRHDEQQPAVPSAAAPPTQAAKAEALLLHFTAEAHRRKWSYDRGLDDDGVPIKSEAFDALHRLGEEMRTALEELRRTPAVVPSAAETTNRAALRDRIAALFRNPPGAERLGDATPGEIADAIMAVLPAPVDRAALLREAADVAREEAHRLETGNHDARAARGARSVAYLLRRLAEAPQPETQARPAAHEWFVETRMIDGYWSKYGASRDTAADGRELFERDTTGSGKAHAFRLVHATTTYAVEAEHQPDTEPQDTPPVEPHPTEADLRHALAVLDAFHGQDGDAP